MQQERRSNHERSGTTRKALLTAARALFVEQGFAETSTPQVATSAGVSRGALYHQFTDKQALFQAVLVGEAEAVARAVDVATSRDSDARSQLVKGAQAYLKAMRNPGRCRLLLVEGPAVLGVGEMRSIDLEIGVRSLVIGLSNAATAHEGGPKADADALLAVADLLSAAFERAALAIDQGAGGERYEQAAIDLLLAAVNGLEHGRFVPPASDGFQLR